MGEKKYKINNIFYAVVGVATLMVAVIGATFAYFTATASNNSIKGDMSSITFDLDVTKVTNVDDTVGLIPMSNNMMEQALKSSKGVCVDDNGNAVCQVYKIVVNNTSASSIFLDGYVTLSGGSGTPTDVTDAFNYEKEGSQSTAGYTATTMRWAQAFCTAEGNNGMVTTCSTGNKIGSNVYSTLRTDSGKTVVEIASLGGDTTKNDGKNLNEIKYKHEDVVGDTIINNNTYKVINKNYIRLSKHTLNSYTYTKSKTGTYSATVHDDTTSALVYNQYLNANDNDADNNTGTSATSFTDSQVFYIVLWLSETGTNQTTGATGAATSKTNFYRGNVTFVTAQGAEVTAAFSGLTKVTPETMTTS